MEWGLPVGGWLFRDIDADLCVELLAVGPLWTSVLATLADEFVVALYLCIGISAMFLPLPHCCQNWQKASLSHHDSGTGSD